METRPVYYNENDSHTASWLRELLRQKVLPDGVVDDRSIADVVPRDLADFAQCHFFAGIGGWPYSLALVGWSGPVWTGSCPRQPFSSAGQHGGTADERHLWPEFYRLIAECHPPVVFGEQVAGKDGRGWLAGVRADLEDVGYAVGAADLCAASAGAPHIRQRLFWVADTKPGGLPSGGIQRPWPVPKFFAADDCPTVQFAANRKARCGQPPIPLVAHGDTADVAASQALGNAIVPQVAAEFVSAYMEIR